MTDTMTLNLKPNPDLSSQTKELIALAEFYTITTAEESVEASEFLARIQKLRRWIDGIYKDAKSPLAMAKRTLDARQKALLDPLAVAERTVMQRIVDYKTLQDNQRQLLEMDARLAAERIARAEQARQAQIVRQLADAAQTSDAASVALHAQADMIEQSPMLVMPAPVVMDTTLAVGVQQRTTYGATVENLRDLVLGIAAQIMVSEYAISADMRTFLTETFLPTPQCSLSMVEASMPTLNALARALRNDLSIPGVTLEKNITLVAK